MSLARSSLAIGKHRYVVALEELLQHLLNGSLVQVTVAGMAGEGVVVSERLVDVGNMDLNKNLLYRVSFLTGPPPSKSQVFLNNRVQERVEKA
jgi:hypothetical protein